MLNEKNLLNQVIENGETSSKIRRTIKHDWDWFGFNAFLSRSNKH